MAEMPEPIPEGSGRNPRGTGGGVPNVTAATDAEEPDTNTGIIERMVEFVSFVDAPVPVS